MDRAKRWLALTPACILLAPHALAMEIGGVRFPETASIAGHPVALNGAALRSWATMRIYAIGLYLPERKATAADALSGSGPKRITLALLRDTSARELTDALVEGMRENHSHAEVDHFQPRMQRLAGVMTAVGVARRGSQITMDFVPGRGTAFALNGERKGETIEGEDFFAALLRIWLGEHPPNAALKEALLGRAR